jgi:NAD(P)-dependent dehydrogenase (short-subunit alcohol dehydrogenase family)
MAFPKKATSDGYDIQMQTNHLSHFLLTSLLMPDLEKAAQARGDARIVNHSSGARSGIGSKAAQPIQAKYMQPVTASEDLGGDDFAGCWQRYQQTKLANVVFTLALKARSTLPHGHPLRMRTVCRMLYHRLHSLFCSMLSVLCILRVPCASLSVIFRHHATACDVATLQ